MTQQPGDNTVDPVDPAKAGGPVNANDLVAFAVEVLAVVLLAVWGAHLGTTTLEHVLAGILVPAIAAVLWGLFAAPRARSRVPALVVATKVLVLGTAIVAAWSLLSPVWAGVVTVVVVVNTLLMWVGPFAHPLGRD
ncbi:YrdB family protein [Terrabacter sp. NPDC080008]|uniref:YrdB family protein n=1 Tax=Terrabacter sp. NPDC080008 TaxID=3155176 RepID=UPI00344B3314